MTKFVVTHFEYCKHDIVREWSTPEAAALDLFMSLRDRRDLDVLADDRIVRTYRHWRPNVHTSVFDAREDKLGEITGDYGVLVKDLEDFIRTLEV